MAYSRAGYSRVSVGVNEPAITLASGVPVGTTQQHTYQGGLDLFEDIIAPNYFLPDANTIYKLGDIIHIDATYNGNVRKVRGTYCVDSITLANGVPTGITVVSCGLSLLTVTMTGAQWQGMFAAPFNLIVPTENNIYLVDNVFYDLQWAAGNVQYGAGGLVSLEYDAIAQAAGVKATETVAAAAFTPAAATVSNAGGVALGANPRANIANKGLYISNDTAAFTNGNSPVKVNVWFKTVRVG